MIHHVCMSVRGAINNAKDLKGAIKIDGRTLDTVPEIKRFLSGLLAEGKEVVPMCDCEGFDFKKGCKGHTSEEADRHEAICKLARAICTKEQESACPYWCGTTTECDPYKEATTIYESRKEAK